MSAARPDTWMPIYWGDYARDTGHLSATMHGAYLMLIKHYWSTGTPLTDDDAQLWRVACCDSIGAWRKIRPVIEKFFDIANGIWRHGRVDKELARAVEITNKRAAAGRASAQQRANTCSTRVENVLPECTQQTGRPSQSPSQEKEERPSVPIGTGAIAPSIEAEVFRRGKALLGPRSGGQVTKLRKALGGDDMLALGVLEKAAGKQNPAEWIAGFLKSRAEPETDELGLPISAPYDAAEDYRRMGVEGFGRG